MKYPLRGMQAYSLPLELTTGNCLSSYQSTASSGFPKLNGTSFIYYNNVILLQSKPLHTLQALQSKSAISSRPSRHISLSFSLPSRQLVKCPKIHQFLLSFHKSNKKSKSNDAAPLRSIYLSLFAHYPRAAGEDIQSCSLRSRHIASDSTASLGTYLLCCVLRQCRDFSGGGTSEARDQEM
jgi:hypothetical protein